MEHLKNYLNVRSVGVLIPFTTMISTLTFALNVQIVGLSNSLLIIKRVSGAEQSKKETNIPVRDVEKD